MMSLLGALKGTSVLAVKIETTGVIAWKPYNTKTQRAWVNGLNFSPFFLVIDVSCERLGERVSSDLLLQAMAGQRRTSLVDCVNNEDSLQRTNSMTKSTCMYIYIYISIYQLYEGPIKEPRRSATEYPCDVKTFREANWPQHRHQTAC